MAWAPLVDLFLESLRLDRGASRHTLDAYSSDLRQWIQSLPELPSTEDLATRYTEMHTQGLAERSLSRKISAMRQFLKFLSLEHGWPPELALALQTPRLPNRLPQTLSADEIERLLTASAEASIRDRALVFTLYSSGLRVSELVGLTLGDIDLELSSVKVRGKGGKQRLVPLAEPARQAIEVYLQESRVNQSPQHDMLFVNQRGAPLTRQGFWLILKGLGLRAGIETSFSPHTLRHAFATHLLQGGMNLRSLQMLLGHSSIATTEIYTHIESRELQEAHRQFHPRGGKIK